MTALDYNTRLAPVVLFVYNRPWHTAQTLNALKRNELADQSVLYIFADGPKEAAKEEDIKKIHEVRQLLRKEQWCKEVHILESDKNKGLADSIVTGVADIVNRYGKIIVLEDDIITSVYFLHYMNNALNFYANEEKVYHISAFMFPIKETLTNYFFTRVMFCWGWGTWKRAWGKFDNDECIFFKKLDNPERIDEFDGHGILDYYSQLKRNVEGQIKTWAVKWYASIFFNEGLCLTPPISFVRNIGMDGTGVNCDDISDYDTTLTANMPVLVSGVVEEYQEGNDAMRRFQQNRSSTRHGFFMRLKNRLKRVIKSQ